MITQHQDFILPVWIPDAQLHCEAVQLGFRKRKSTVVIDWILRRDNEKDWA
jgi:hypothetical protein